MSFLLWRCKRLTRKIWKMEAKHKRISNALKILSKWIKADEKKLNNFLRNLGSKETAQYGFDMGFISDLEYHEMLKEKLNERSNKEMMEGKEDGK